MSSIVTQDALMDGDIMAHTSRIMSTFRCLFFGAVTFSFTYVIVLLYTSSDIGPTEHEKRHLPTVQFLRSELPMNTNYNHDKTINPDNASISTSHSPTTKSTIPKKKTVEKINTETVEKNVQLLIITRWRSGSSFTGEIFNNNPDFAYFFEPLIGTVGSKSGNRFGEHHVSVLQDILNCNFIKTNYTWWDGQIPINCGKSLTFSHTILCTFFHAGEQSNNITSSLVEEACRSRRHVAIKTVRMPDMKYLERIVSNPNSNVKVIHLIRDPRALYLSRASTPDVDNMYHDECDEMEQNLKYWKNPPSWLRGRHMLLRYEDLADDPFSITEEIYQFLGLKVPKTVKIWLEYNTNWNDEGQFSRARISNEAAVAWRTKIYYYDMLRVQRRCIVPILMAGYRQYKSQEELMDLSLPGVSKFPYPLQPNITEFDDIWDKNEASYEDHSAEHNLNIRDTYVHRQRINVNDNVDVNRNSAKFLDDVGVNRRNGKFVDKIDVAKWKDKFIGNLDQNDNRQSAKFINANNVNKDGTKLRESFERQNAKFNDGFNVNQSQVAKLRDTFQMNKDKQKAKFRDGTNMNRDNQGTQSKDGYGRRNAQFRDGFNVNRNIQGVKFRDQVDGQFQAQLPVV